MSGEANLREFLLNFIENEIKEAEKAYQEFYGELLGQYFRGRIDAYKHVKQQLQYYDKLHPLQQGQYKKPLAPDPNELSGHHLEMSG